MPRTRMANPLPASRRSRLSLSTEGGILVSKESVPPWNSGHMGHHSSAFNLLPRPALRLMAPICEVDGRVDKQLQDTRIKCKTLQYVFIRNLKFAPCPTQHKAIKTRSQQTQLREHQLLQLMPFRPQFSLPQTWVRRYRKQRQSRRQLQWRHLRWQFRILFQWVLQRSGSA